MTFTVRTRRFYKRRTSLENVPHFQLYWTQQVVGVQTDGDGGSGGDDHEINGGPKMLLLMHGINILVPFPLHAKHVGCSCIEQENSG